MKTLKISAVVLALSMLVAGVGVFAETSRTYTGIDLPAYSGIVSKGPATKTGSGAQYYENSYNINLCTSNYNDVSVRVYSEKNGNSSWMTVSKGSTSSWKESAKTTTKDAYNLNIKNKVWGLCESQHWGTWYLDK